MMSTNKLIKTLSAALLLSCLFTSNILSGQSGWKKTTINHINNLVLKSNCELKAKPLFELDQNFLKAQLELCPEFGQKMKAAPVEISLPRANGELALCKLYQSDILNSSLNAKYPDIHSYRGYLISDPGSLVRCDISPEGFHAMILLTDSETEFIDPVMVGKKQAYVAYKKNEKLSKGEAFQCKVTGKSDTQTKAQKSAAPDCTLRKYRLALSCTGEYANFHGGTKPKVLAAMNTTMTRVSGVYERDFAVTFEIIANNDLLIFLNSNTDPFTNDDGGTMLDENQQTVDNIIGNTNYDIGHVFSTGGGGIASLFSVCSSNNKAMGVTGSGSPVGDGFDIDYVAHEIGHQFNGNHSFNNECGGNVSQSTAYETGSGSTIMAYAGVCDPNVQNNSDDLFHIINLDEISTYITVQNGNTCPEKIDLNNNAPTVNAGVDQFIPKSTAFELTATGTDPDGDVLTYEWEQYDKELTPQPPTSTATQGPLFRSFKPTSSPTRIFPRLSNIINNTASQWEVLPSVPRTMNFRVAVRDNHDGGGCFAIDAVKLNVATNAGPFLVTQPNTLLTWEIGSQVQVLWNVENTNIAPVNSPKVDIFLSLNGGNTYPIILAKGVDNNGMATIDVPNNASNQCRVKIKGSNNVFFDISNVNFIIKQPLLPNYLVDITESDYTLCALSSSDTIMTKLKFQSLTGFNSPVNLAATNLPIGMTIEFDKNPVIPSDSVELRVFGLKSIPSGSYLIPIETTSGAIIKTKLLNIGISSSIPGQSKLLEPSNYQRSVSTQPLLTWAPAVEAQSYFVEISDDFLGKNIVWSQETKDTFGLVDVKLENYGIYYWRVRPSNTCDFGLVTGWFSFQTINKECSNYDNIIPIVIPNNSTFNFTSTLNITSTAIISELTAKVVGTHNYIGDLALSLRKAGKEVILVNQECDDLKNINATFADDGSPLVCSPIPPAIGGKILPTGGKLSSWNATAANGIWNLDVVDVYDADGGTINNWSLNICSEKDTTNIPTLVSNDTLFVLALKQTIIRDSLLKFVPAKGSGQINYLVTELPKNGKLNQIVNPVKLGDTFTQANIVNGLMRYIHEDITQDRDSVLFDVIDVDGHWLAKQNLQIIIYQALTADVKTTEVTCFGDDDGQINILPEGGVPSYTLTINDAPTTDFNPANLPKGNYKVEVKDKIGNIFTSNVIVTSPDQLEATLVSTDKTLEVKVIGGTPPYQITLNGQLKGTDTLFTDLKQGFYVIGLKDSQGCEFIDSLLVLNTNVVDVNSSQWKIMPNPSKGIAQLIVPFDCKTKLEILSSEGKHIWSMPTQVFKSGQQIYLPEIAPGIYLIQLHYLEKRELLRWIVVK